MLNQSFDVFFADGSAINCEYSGKSSIKDKGRWSLFKYSADGLGLTAYGEKIGTRAELMRFVEKLVEFEEK